MQHKELVRAQIEFEETETVPYAGLKFEGDVEDRLNSYYGCSSWKDKIENSVQSIPSVKNISPEQGVELTTDAYGTKWQMNRRPYHIVEPPLKEPDLNNYKLPAVENFFPSGWRESFENEANEKNEYFLITDYGFGLFERTWSLRGFENVLMDLVLRPDFYLELISKVAEHQMEILKKLVTLPVDGIIFGDDWGYQNGVIMGPELWRKYIKPHMAEMYEIIHSSGKYTFTHCCGNIEEIIPDLIGIGLDVLESIQPEAMDPYRVKKKYGKKIALWGGLGSQSTIQFGTPDDIKKEVEKLRNEMSRGSGYILGPAKPLQPGTPTENAAAVIEAFVIK